MAPVTMKFIARVEVPMEVVIDDTEHDDVLDAATDRATDDIWREVRLNLPSGSAVLEVDYAGPGVWVGA